MTTFSIPLPEDRVSQLLLHAERVGLSPEEYLRRCVEEILDRQDQVFRGAVEHVLTKNAELYRRLA
jgi:hypothetical protein